MKTKLSYILTKVNIIWDLPSRQNSDPKYLSIQYQHSQRRWCKKVPSQSIEGNEKAESNEVSGSDFNRDKSIRWFFLFVLTGIGGYSHLISVAGGR